MPISRGSIKHTVVEDLWAFIITLFLPQIYSKTATELEKENLAKKVCKQFNANHAITFPYARTAVHDVLMSMNLQRGSEVLITPITIGPMLEIILSLGLRPTFIDIELTTYGPEIKDLELKIKSRPSVFLLTYLFGYIPNIKKITEICDKNGTKIIEDISHNIGGQFGGKKLGTFGIAGIYSASMLKYVDGYNGAFVITNDDNLNESLKEAVRRLSSPSKRRIRHCIQKTFWWNLALSRYVFSFATFPALALLKAFRPDLFEGLVGPSIFLKLEQTSLPKYYFEDISGFQCRMIEKQLDKLDGIIEDYQKIAKNAKNAFIKVKSEENLKFDIYEEKFCAKNTYWQLVIPVKNLMQARKILFNHGVETNTTNLTNLADACGIKLQNAQKLKDSHIFIPLHKHLTENDYIKIYVLLNKAGLI